MDLNIGTNIKRLRLAKGLTQEQLADLLNISPAAISKWEAKNTYPDITMLFPLAEIFGISVDELMGYDEAKVKESIDKLLAEYRQLHVDGRLDECTDLIIKARKKYPHDYRIMIKYMWDKAGGSFGNNAEKLLEHKDEFTQICDCILEGCTEDNLRAEAIEMKAKLLHTTGDSEAAVALLSTLPSEGSRMMIERLFANDTPEFHYWNKKNCCALMDSMAFKLARIVRFDDSLTLPQKINRLETIADIFCEIGRKQDLSYFCIAERTVCATLAGMLTADNAQIEEIVRIREKEFTAIEKMMQIAITDQGLKDGIRKAYKTDNILDFELNRLLSSPHPQLAKLREYPEFMEMLKKWKR